MPQVPNSQIWEKSIILGSTHIEHSHHHRKVKEMVLVWHAHWDTKGEGNGEHDLTELCLHKDNLNISMDIPVETVARQSIFESLVSDIESVK